MRELWDGTEGEFLRHEIIDGVIEPDAEFSVVDAIDGFKLIVGDVGANNGVAGVKNQNIIVEGGAELTRVRFK